jgi:DNA-binding NarL/FixJ family response regulator
LRLFIVDDSRIVRQRLVAMLSEQPEIEIIGEAEDAFSAIDGIRALDPDVVILDIHLPGSATGIYVLESIRRRQNRPAVIMLTNYSFQQYRKRCMQAGATYFFDKSTEFEKVPQALQELLSTITRPSPTID